MLAIELVLCGTGECDVTLLIPGGSACYILATILLGILHLDQRLRHLVQVLTDTIKKKATITRFLRFSILLILLWGGDITTINAVKRRYSKFFSFISA